jgi:hypothetical protein
LNSRNRILDQSIGVVFTPSKWASWLITRNKIADAWIDGATVLDPTCGEGQFLLSLIDAAIHKGHSVQKLPLKNLFGIERHQKHLQSFLERCKTYFGVDFPNSNLQCSDLLLDRPSLQADVLIGNPPWQNFADLPGQYKERIKPLFLQYELVRNKREVLLGSSRIDIAALIIVKAIVEHLNSNGSAFFFIPLSLLLNEGAHSGFRRFTAKGVSFGLREFFDFDGIEVFPGVATRYGVAHFKRDMQTEYPVPYYYLDDSRWKHLWATPTFENFGPLSIFENQDSITEILDSRISMPSDARPRQGVNTCGANGTLIFTDCHKIDQSLSEATSKDFGGVVLPSRFLYPLLEKEVFLNSTAAPSRYVLLPYDERTGKPLPFSQLKEYPEVWNYLRRAAPVLKSRKGKLIGTWIQRGLWWASLGVGSYCFAPYKVAWMAYGESHFEPRIFQAFNGKHWQGNQALHAFIPCKSREQAEEILKVLSRPQVNSYLQSFRMNGTRSWAQPGRMSKLFEFVDEGTTEELSLFS